MTRFASGRAGKLLPREFYARDPRLVAPDLLGRILVRREGRLRRAGRIVETEAYLGAEDAAAHSAAGETPRNAVLFGPPGHAYVYFTYGMHYCMNVSCQPAGQAGCVLLRALEPVEGIARMADARGIDIALSTATPRALQKIAGGPARLCEALDISRERDNGKDVCSPRSDLLIWNDGISVPPRMIMASPRIGIRKAMELPLRFSVAGSAFVSRPFAHKKR